jgi:hypothetical protein
VTEHLPSNPFAPDPDYVPPQQTPEEERAWAAWHAWSDKHAQWRAAVGREHSWPDQYEPEHNWYRSTMPRIRLLCPAGHRLVTVEEGNGWGVLATVGEAYGRSPEAGRAVVFDAAPPSPSRGGLVTCDADGCWKGTVGVRCEEHARRPVDLLPREAGGTLRWQLRCPNRRCRYDGRWSGARLFMVYVVACYAGVSEVRLPC